MMVAIARGKERSVDSGLAPVGDEVEPEGVAVERDPPVQIGHSQVDMSHANGGMDRFGSHAGSLPGVGRAIIRGFIYPTPGFGETMSEWALGPLPRWSAARVSARS